MGNIYINIKGLGHNKPGDECEDVLYYSETEGIYCLADGVSNSPFGKAGAETLVTSMFEYLSDDKTKDFLENSSIENIREFIVNFSISRLSKICEKYNTENIDDFASTLLVCVRTSKNNITVIHAGDGLIVGVLNTEQPLPAQILPAGPNMSLCRDWLPYKNH